MLGDISKAKMIYIATGYTDMRESIDGLTAIVQQNFHLDPMFQFSFPLLCGRNSSKLKALYWEEDGFVLLYKKYSIIETAKANGIDPYRYLSFILTYLPSQDLIKHPESFDMFLPWSKQTKTYCK